MTISVSEPTTFDALSFATQALSSPRALAAVLDHTLLKPEATRTQIQHLCAEAAEYGFACAMVNPAWVETAVRRWPAPACPSAWWSDFRWARRSRPPSARRPRRC